MRILKNIINKYKNKMDDNLHKQEHILDNNLEVLKERLSESYGNIKSLNEIAIFILQASQLVKKHMEESEYKEHTSLLREVNFLLHYSFSVIQDDFFLGQGFLKQRMTKLDDYIFSQYRKDIKLRYNIKKLTTVAFSNRFEKDPRKNLLSYFVFLEETGLEIIVLLQDFYIMLEASQKQASIFNINNKKHLQLNKNYKKEDGAYYSPGGPGATLFTQMTEAISPIRAQRKIFDEMIMENKQ